MLAAGSEISPARRRRSAELRHAAILAERDFLSVQLDSVPSRPADDVNV